jgi:glycolate oxidase FAD binding subunit
MTPSELRPGTIEEAQAMLAGGQGRVAFVGGGTASGPLPEVDAVIRTGALNRIVEYAPPDQVVIAEAGVTLQALQRELAKHGQRLSLEAPFADRATLGGIVAANSFGPLRARYGSVRDLIIGVSILRADGARAKGGGKVVKTVAGFDLPKLMCGSRGTLGMIATVTFRVHPVPEHSVTVAARGLEAAGVVELVRKVRALQLEPAAMLASLTQRGWHVALRFEGFRAGVVQQRDKLRDLPDAPASLWEEHLASRGPVRFAALPTQLPSVQAAFASDAQLSWYPTLGLGFARSAGGARAALSALGGWLAAEGDWGPPPSSLPLHQAVKARLDPARRLAPGSFVGGI